MSDYKYEFLGSGIYVAVSKEHTFGTDAVLLPILLHRSAMKRRAISARAAE